MKVGVNLTTALHLPLVTRLYEDRIIDYCEVLLDGFWYWPAPELRSALGDMPSAFHVMHTNLLERSEVSLRTLTDKIKTFAELLDPIYISDHIARFTNDGRPYAILQEPAFTNDSSRIMERLLTYRRSVGAEVIFENFPTTRPSGEDQVSFFAHAQERGFGLLLDASNAVVAQLNGGAATKTWEQVGSRCSHFHIGGFRPSLDEPLLTMDSHDCGVADESVEFLVNMVRRRNSTSDVTVTVEWDQDISYENFKRDVSVVRAAVECR